MTYRQSLTILGAAAWLASAATADAQDMLDLTVSDAAGQVEVTFSLADLDAMEQSEFTTTTIWTEGPVTFSGVALSTVLAQAGIQGTAVTMTALNDYAVEMPLSQITQTSPLVATRLNGAVMSVRDRGPFWIVYDYDADIEFQTETIYARSIWQLNRLRLMD